MIFLDPWRKRNEPSKPLNADKSSGLYRAWYIYVWRKHCLKLSKKNEILKWSCRRGCPANSFTAGSLTRMFGQILGQCSAALCQGMAGGETLPESVKGVSPSSCPVMEKGKVSCSFGMKPLSLTDCSFHVPRTYLSVTSVIDPHLAQGLCSLEVSGLWNVNVTFIM